jgi:hypothetical protein
MGSQAAQLIPVLVFVVVAVWFEARCMIDLARADRVRNLSREAWALLMVITIPLGGILYLMYGKER